MNADLYAFRRNVVLVASAGTGKTHALVGVLLHALLGVSAVEPLDPSRIAATTFSRKAAAEIHERLVTELERLAFGGPSPYDADLRATAQDKDWATLCPERARRALAGIERATIGTLHGLAYSIARTHAFAVGLAPSLAMASEDDTEVWANEAVALSLGEHAARDADAIRDLFRLLTGRDRAQAELVRLLLALDDDGRSASALALPEDDGATLDATVRKFATAAGANDAYSRRDVPTLVPALAQLFGDRLLREDSALSALRAELAGSTHRERAELLVHAWAASGRIEATAALVRDVLSSAQARLAELHARAGAVGFGATLRLARDALRDDPAAASRASGAYDALLVDEFQDTSRVQVELLRLLWERSPRSRTPGTMPAFGDLRERGLLIVGDRKQSIYAFRGADVGVFVTTCIELAGESARAALGVAPGIVPLPPRATADFFVLRENHRANAGLVAFANAFSLECLRADSDDLFEARYVEATEALLPSAQTRPTATRVTWLRAPQEPGGQGRDTTRLEDATLVTAYIAAAVGRERGDDGSLLAFRDFAVLAQSSEMLDAAAFTLSRAGIPHVVAGRGFFAAREVQDLLSILRFIERPADRAALLAVLRGPCAALSDRTLLGLTEAHRGLSVAIDRWDTLERRVLVEDGDRDALDRVKRALIALRRSAERLGPGRTLREAVRELEIEQKLLLLPRGVQRVANVRKLLRLADGAPTIRALLERVARAEARAREPEAATFAEDDDAVRLLTIHASKGLAFRVVLIPELRASPIRSANTTVGIDLRTDKAWLATKVLDDRGEPVTTPSLRRLMQSDRARLRADRRRTMYVAVTRARERLVFIGSAKAATRPEPHFGGIVASLANFGAIDIHESPPDAPVASLRSPPTDVTFAAPRAPRTREIAIAPTALQDFRHCARRFELVHVAALPEPTPRALGRFRVDGGAETNARAEGQALHALLERIDARTIGGGATVELAKHTLGLCDVDLDEAAERRVLAAATRFLDSAYARGLHKASEVWRERAFVVTITSEAMTLTLRGAMDLVAFWPNGDVDVIDYKSARGPDLRPHTLQLDLYAYAAQVQLASQHVRAGAMFLGSDGAEPRFRPPIVAKELEAELIELAVDLAEKRAAARFPRANPKTCHAIGCGYFTLCHPEREKRQLELFAR